MTISSDPAAFRMTAAHFEARELKLRATTAENSLAEAEALIAELHGQLDRANATAVRLARRAVTAPLPRQA